MSHRLAYGSHRVMSPMVKAKNVAESILAHQLPLTVVTWQRYGLDDNPAQREMVTDLLRRWAVKV